MKVEDKTITEMMRGVREARSQQRRLDSLISSAIGLAEARVISDEIVIESDGEVEVYTPSQVTHSDNFCRVKNRKLTRMSQSHKKAQMIETKIVRVVQRNITQERVREAQRKAGFDISEHQYNSQVEKHLNRLMQALTWVTDSNASKPLLGSHYEILSETSELVNYTLEMWVEENPLSNLDLVVSFLDMVSSEVNDKVSMLHSKGAHQSHPRMFDELMMCSKLLMEAAESAEFINGYMK